MITLTRADVVIRPYTVLFSSSFTALLFKAVNHNQG